MRSRYKCVAKSGCGREFEAAHYREVRRATGRTVECCGEVARWLQNVPDEPGSVPPGKGDAELIGLEETGSGASGSARDA